MTVGRFFVAVAPGTDVRQRLHRAVVRVKTLAASARWVDAGRMHVTLAFLGDVDSAQIAVFEAAMRQAAALHTPFEVRFRGAGVFRGEAPRVLWAGIAEGVEPLTVLQHDLAQALTSAGWTEEERPFRAHVTLARARERRGDPSLVACADALAGESFGATRVDAAVLFRSELTSEGQRYTPIATMPLCG